MLKQMSISSRPSKMSHPTNNLSFQRSNSGCINYAFIKNTNLPYSASCKYENSSLVRQMCNMLLRCVPTATCLSHNSEVSNGTFVHGGDVENVKEDTLPGVRLQRSSLGPRTNTHISEHELNQWLEKETGIDRVRMMFSVRPDGTFVQEGTRDINTTFYQTVVMGSVVSVITAAASEHIRKQEKALSNNLKVLNKALNEQAALRRIVTGSLKGTLRFSIFSASLLYLSQTIAAYRNKSSVWEYAIASTIAFPFLDVSQGVRHCAKLAFRGAVLGTLGGYVVCHFLAIYGINQEQKHLEYVRHHLEEQNRIKQTA